MPQELTTLPVQLDLADRLREFRTRRRASLGEVARAIGTSSAYLSALETRRIENPGYKTILALAHFYRVSIIQLIGPLADAPPVSLSFEDAIEHLRWNASSHCRAALVEMAQLMLGLAHDLPDRDLSTGKKET